MTLAPASAAAVAPARSGTLAPILTVLGGNIGAALVGFAANVWAMRTLGPEQYGGLSAALVVLFVAWQFTGKGLDQAAVCLGARGATGAAVFGNVLVLKIAGNAALVGLALLLGRPLASVLLGSGATAGIVVLAVIGAAGASFCGFVAAAIQAEARFGAYALVQIAGNGIRLAGFVLLAIAGAFDVRSALVATLAGFAGAAVLGVWVAPRETCRPRWDGETVATVVRFARWTLISSVLYLLYTRLDVLLLSSLCGGATVGVYAAALTILQIIDLVTSSTVTVLLPKFSSQSGRAALRAQIRAALTTGTLLALPLAAGYFLIRPGVALLVSLAGPGYAGMVPLLEIMYFGVLFTVVTHPLHVLFFALGRPHVLTMIDLAMLLIIGAGHYLAITFAGAVGAAWVVLGSRVVLGLVLLVGVKLELGVEDRA